MGSVLLVLYCAWGPGLALADTPVAEGALRVEGIAALIGGSGPAAGVEVVLRSDVDLRARLALAERDPGAAVAVHLPGRLLQAALDDLVGESLIVREARRLRLLRPTGQELAAARRGLERGVGSAEGLRRLCASLGVGEAELDAIVDRRATVSAFVRSNLASGASLDEADLERAHERGDHPFAGRSLQEVRAPLRVWLLQRRLERSMTAWLDEVRARVPVKILVRYV